MQYDSLRTATNLLVVFAIVDRLTSSKWLPNISEDVRFRSFAPPWIFTSILRSQRRKSYSMDHHRYSARHGMCIRIYHRTYSCEVFGYLKLGER